MDHSYCTLPVTLPRLVQLPLFRPLVLLDQPRVGGQQLHSNGSYQAEVALQLFLAESFAGCEGAHLELIPDLWHEFVASLEALSSWKGVLSSEFASGRPLPMP